MSTTVQPTQQQQQHQHQHQHQYQAQQYNPTFQQNWSKWASQQQEWGKQFQQQQQWNQNQVINPNYSSQYNPEVLCQNVIRDPRYQRLKVKWDPKMSQKGGVKQKAKNFIDPINIPYIGAAVAWKRAGDANASREKVGKLKEENESAPQQIVLDAMHTNSKVNQAGTTAKAGAKTFFMFFPLVYAVPAGDQTVSDVASKAASSAASKGIEKGAQKAAGDFTPDDSAQVDANESWGASKALLQYLGEPRNNDPVYTTWETSRVQLKEFFGCGPDDNLWLMEPKGEELKRIESAENSDGGYNLASINVPLLVLLWRIYDCWSEQYADKLTTQKHKMSKQQRERTEDERDVLQMISPIDTHIQQLNEISQKEIARMLRDPSRFGYGSHPLFSFLEERSDTKKEKRLNWILKSFAAKFLESGMAWGYFSDATNTGKQGELLAVVLFERAEQDHYEPSDMLNTFSGMMKLKTDYSAISKRLSWEQKIMRQQMGDDAENSRGILHYYACQPTPQGEQALSILLRSQIDYTSIPTYCSEYSDQHDRIRLLESVGFHQKPVAQMSQKEKETLTLDVKDSESALSMTIMEHIPAARAENAYMVPNAPYQAQTPLKQA